MAENAMERAIDGIAGMSDAAVRMTIDGLRPVLRLAGLTDAQIDDGVSRMDRNKLRGAARALIVELGLVAIDPELVEAVRASLRARADARGWEAIDVADENMHGSNAALVSAVLAAMEGR